MSTLFTTFVLMPLPRPSICIGWCMGQTETADSSDGWKHTVPRPMPTLAISLGIL